MSELGEERAKLRLRYPAACVECGIALPPGTDAFYSRSAKQATCLSCAPLELPLDQGVAGASAAAEGERRAQRRVDSIRRRHGDHAAAVATAVIASEPEIASWAKGSAGESRLAAFVDRKVGDRVIALHDRLIPGTRRNIDHLFVAPTGVWVVDAKAYKGRVVKRDVGPFWRSNFRVYVGGRNQTNKAKAVESQVAVVLAALKSDPTAKGIEVHAALCFLDSEWGLLDLPFQVGSTWVLHPHALTKRLRKDGDLSRERMERIASRLALSLPSAT